MVITIEVPEDLAARLRSTDVDLKRVLELGLREWQATSPTFAGLHGVLETLAKLPEPEEVLALRPTPEFQERLEMLVEKSREQELSEVEKQEWEHFEYIEHLLRLAKIRASLKLQSR